MAKRLPPRLEPDTSGNFYAVYSEGGRSRRKSLRTKDLFRAEHRFEGWLEAKRKAQLVEDDPYVEDCLDYWMDQWIRGRMMTEDRYVSVVNNLKEYFGKMRVGQITRKDSATYIELRRSAQITGRIGWGAANSTIQHEMKELIACFNFMRKKVEPRERRLPEHIIPFIEPPEASPPRNRVFSPDELDRLWQYATAPENCRARECRFIVLAMETAQRKSAIIELQWPQVNLDIGKGRIFFNPEGRAQTRKVRPPLPVSSRLRPLLEQYQAEKTSEFVLDSTTDVQYGLKRIADGLGIKGLTPHVFRHTWATNAALAGKDMAKVAAFMGDTEDTVRKNYIHLTPDYLDDVVS
tara:strand:- start:89 stop:1138 length:1050 start_codon:yes stop_codon:yes gene_type:complete